MSLRNPPHIHSLADSVKYWRDTLGMKQVDNADDNARCVLEFGPDQAKLVLEEVGGGGKVDHKTAFGRIAFAVPSKVNFTI